MADFFIDPDIARARTLDTSFYNSPVHLETAKEKIFASSWQFAGSKDQVAETETAYPFVLLGGYLDEPLMLTKDKDGVIRCLSNVCTHRGNLLAYEPCKTRNLRCKYHGRMFSLDGKFQSMPEFKEVEDFPSAADDLHNLPVFSWGKLLFTSLHMKTEAGKYFADMMQRLEWFPIDDMEFKPELSKDFSVKANWALYCENYLEGFHIPFVHAGLNQVLDFGSYTTETFGLSSLQLGIAKKGDVCFDLPASSPDYGKQIAAYYFWVFPNMMFNFYPWGLSLNIVTPNGAGECRVSFLSFVSDPSKLGQGAGSGLDTVELEDEDVVEHVQLGVRSRFYSHGRYSVNREQGTHHFHSLIAQFMNA